MADGSYQLGRPIRAVRLRCKRPGCSWGVTLPGTTTEHEARDLWLRHDEKEHPDPQKTVASEPSGG